jgi:glycosyltransferase involved in cell wall biosynthesis
MRILLTVTNYPPLPGGLGVYVQNLAEQLGGRGHEVTVLTMQGKDFREEIRGLIRVVSVPRDLSYRDVFALPVAPATYRVIASEISRADVVNAHTRYFPLTFISVKQARKAGVPVLVTEHGGGFVRGASLLTVGGARLADMTTGRWALRNCSGVLSVSAKSQEFVKNLSGVTAEIVGNGLDLDFWNRQRAVGNQSVAIPADRVRNIVFVGRIVAEKGWSLLLSAWRKIPEPLRRGYRLVFVGDGPDLNKLRQEIARLNLTDVLAVGQQPRTMIRDLLCSGVLVNPSRAAEGFQTTLLEARAVGAYVLTTPVGGAVETVTDQQLGLVIDSEDPEIWAAEISGALAQAGVAVGRSDISRYGWPELAERYAKALGAARSTNLVL